MKNLPFTQKKEGVFLIREFSKDTSTRELVWHRDRQDREVTVLEGTGWQIQMDNKLPEKMLEGKTYYIPKNTYHRVMRGESNLVLQIRETSFSNDLLRKYVRSMLSESVVTGRKLDRYASAIKRHVIKALKDSEVRDYFSQSGSVSFRLQDVPEVLELDNLRNVIVHMEEGQSVAADAAYEFDLNATPEQRKTSDLRVNLFLPRNYPDQFLSQISDELIDAIRHELEHSGQETWELMDCQKKTPSPDMIWASLKNAAEYYLCPAEVKAHIAGYMKRAKSKRVPLGDVIDRELDMIFSTGRSQGYSEESLMDFMKKVRSQYYAYASQRDPRAEGVI